MEHDSRLKSAVKGFYSCCLLLDLTKAFHSLDHKILIKKIKHPFCIRSVRLELFGNYLTNRVLYTRANNIVDQQYQNLYVAIPKIQT